MVDFKAIVFVLSRSGRLRFLSTNFSIPSLHTISCRASALLVNDKLKQNQSITSIVHTLYNSLKMSTATTEMTMEFYRKALNFNVIGRYDPKIKQLLFHTPHASLYKWEFDKDEWNKLDCQGVLAIYLRDVSNPSDFLQDSKNYQDQNINTLAVQSNGEVNIIGQVLTGRDIYNYGLIILNRINPDNFSMGILPNSAVNKRKVFDAPDNMQNPLDCMGVEVKDELVIIKNLKHEVYGIWIHTAADRQNIYELIKYLLENDPKDSFT